MRRGLLPAVALALAPGCSSTAPVQGARVLDAGQAELLIGAEAGLVEVCLWPDQCSNLPWLAPQLGARVGMVDRWLDAGLRLSLVQAQLDAKVELVRTPRFALAVDPALVLALSGSLNGQALAVGELSPSERLSLLAFGGPYYVLHPTPVPIGDQGLAGIGIDVRPRDDVRFQPWIALRLPPGEVKDPLAPTLTVGVAAALRFPWLDDAP